MKLSFIARVNNRITTGGKLYYFSADIEEFKFSRNAHTLKFSKIMSRFENCTVKVTIEKVIDGKNVAWRPQKPKVIR